MRGTRGSKIRLGVTAFVVSAVLSACCGWALRDFALDDAFITYRYARNVANGHGLVYHQGEHVLGTSTPAYAFLLAALHSATGVAIPVVSRAVRWTLISVAGGLLAILMSTTVRWGTGVTAAALLASNPVLQLSAGMEAPLYLVLIVLLLVLCEHKRPIEVGVVFGVAVLVRLDALVLAVVPVWAWWRANDRAIAWLQVTSAALVVVLPWALYASWIYGSPIPASLHAKQHLYDVLSQAEPHRLFVRGFFDIPYWLMTVSPGLAVLVPLVLAGMILYLQRSTSWLSALGVWTAAYVVAFEWVDLPNLSIWYWAPVQLLVIVCVTFAIDAAFECALCEESRWSWAVPSLLSVVTVAVQLATATMVDTPGRAGAYRAVGEAVTCPTPDDAIATWEIGIVGYYSQCRIVDFAGLVSPESVGHPPDAVIERQRPKWIVSHHHADYEPWRDFPSQGAGMPAVRVYVRKASPIPETSPP